MYSEIGLESIKIKFSNGEIGCKVLGNGVKKMISFHGFGQSGSDFAPLAMSMPEYSLFSIELPFHGSSKIRDPLQPMTAPEVVEIVANLMSQQDIPGFSVCGFSIGARFLFPIIEQFANVIDQVIFMAPDGISRNFWFSFATGSSLSRRIFHRLVTDYTTMRKVIALAVGVKLISRKRGIFAERLLAENGQGQKVYDTWCYLRALKMNKKRVVDAINLSGIHVAFVFGANDHIIRKRNIIPLHGKLRKFEVLEMPGGHYDLIAQYSRSAYVKRLN